MPVPEYLKRFNALDNQIATLLNDETVHIPIGYREILIEWIEQLEWIMEGEIKAGKFDLDTPAQSGAE